jgi:hypothetical protein
MKLRPILVLMLLAGVTSMLAAHDLFLTLRDYFVPAQSDIRVIGLNGTFSKSENSIDRVRIADLSVVTPAGRKQLDTTAVTADGPRTVIRIHTEAEGTYAAGFATKPSELSQKADSFNLYLAEEGIGPTLAERKRTGELGKPARERYSKHVKILFQVGKARGDGWSAILGYPVEIVPLRNPYESTPADTLRFRIQVDGAPSPAGQEVIAGGRTAAGVLRKERLLTTDAQGQVTVPPGPAGVWYVKFIRMTRTGQPGVDYISQWATLTFAVAPSGKAP